MTTERHAARPGRPGTDPGFTLVELLVGIVVLGILAGITVLGVGRFRSDARAAACNADVATVGRAAMAYDAATGGYPTSVDVLVAGKYLKAAPSSGTYAFTASTKTVSRTPACGDGGTAGGPSESTRLTGIAGKCIDLADAAGADGTSVQLGTCDGRTSQRWTAPASWPGAITVLGKCLDVRGGLTDNRTRVQLTGCNSTGGQVWTPGPGGTLVNPKSGRCLDAENVATADGTPLIIWDCHGNINQRWAFAV